MDAGGGYAVEYVYEYSQSQVVCLVSITFLVLCFSTSCLGISVASSCSCLCLCLCISLLAILARLFDTLTDMLLHISVPEYIATVLFFSTLCYLLARLVCAFLGRR